jgi:hypothetical protein
MEDQNVLEMRRRIRTHMLVSFFGAFAGIAVSLGLGGVVNGLAAGASWAGAATGVFVLGGIALIPIIGWTSTYRNLRCPACNGSVWWQVSQKYSAFGAMASNQCSHCGVTLFAPSASRRFFFMMIGLAGFFFFAALAFGAAMQLHAHP